MINKLGVTMKNNLCKPRNAQPIYSIMSDIIKWHKMQQQ